MRFAFLLISFFAISHHLHAENLQMEDDSPTYTEKAIYAEKIKGLSIVPSASIIKNCNYGGFRVYVHAVEGLEHTFVLEPGFISLSMGCGGRGHFETVQGPALFFPATRQGSDGFASISIKLMVPSNMELQITEVKE